MRLQYTWNGFMIICHAYLQPMFICCSPHDTVDLLSFHGCLLTAACQDRLFIRSKSAFNNNTQWMFRGHPYTDLRLLFVRLLPYYPLGSIGAKMHHTKRSIGAFMHHTPTPHLFWPRSAFPRFPDLVLVSTESE